MGALVLACFLVWKVAPVVRKWSRFMDRVTGVPADPKTGQPEILGIFERMDHQDETLKEQSVVLETIRHEVEFNNGSSVKDAVRRIESHLKDSIVDKPVTTTINVNGG
jgi:hypothetical protein